MTQQTIRKRLKTIFPFLAIMAEYVRSIKKLSVTLAAKHPPVGENGIRIICYEDLDAWILGKFAKKMHYYLGAFGNISDIAKVGDETAAIGHHIIYYDAEKKWAPVETFMITHLDQDWKIEKVKQQLELYDMGVCMSEETCDNLRKITTQPDRLCYINPAHDGVIRPRPIVLGIASKVHPDGRKKENAIIDVMTRFPVDAFTLKIMGMGWESQVATLTERGYRVEYFEKFDYAVYTAEFMPSLDYYIYFTHDEGAMAFVDAVAADVQTIVTPQGYHLDVVDGIDHRIDNQTDLVVVLQEIHDARMQRVARVADWSWKEYTWRHLVLWDYLLLKTTPAIIEQTHKFLDETRTDNTVAANFQQDLALPVPAEETLLRATEKSKSLGMQELSLQYARQRLIYYPKNSELKNLVLKHYPKVESVHD
jgi:hypothetical protein